MRKLRPRDGKALVPERWGRVRMRTRTCFPRHFFALLIVSKHFLTAPSAVQSGVMHRCRGNWLCPAGACSRMGRDVH